MKKNLLLITIVFLQPLFSQQKKITNIIRNHAKAIGGIEHWGNLKSSRIVTETQRENGVFTITATMLRPNSFRLDFLNNEKISIKSYNGVKGWIVVNGERKEMNDGETKEMAEEGSFYEELAFSLKNKNKLEYLGEELLDGKKVIKIKMTKSETDEQVYYVNAKTYFIEMVSEYSEDANFKGTYFKTKMKNYKSFDGYYFPTRMELYANDKLFRTYKTIKVEINPKIEESYFNPPNTWLTEKHKVKLNEFDFWLGEWDIFNYGTDILVGRSKIEKAAGGFGIKESFYAIPGPFHGNSLNKYNFFTGKWEQLWIDNSGMSHFFTGNYSEEKGMYFTKEEKRGNTTIYHRFIIKPISEGQVRQTWYQSSDKEKWEKVFDGAYKRKTDQ